MKLRRNALFIFEVGEEKMWIGRAEEWIENLTSDPFSISVQSLTNRQFREDDVDDKDIVFLANMLMPDPDGFVILSRLAQSGTSVPIVVSSAAMSRQTFFRHLPVTNPRFHGQVTFLEKPFRLDDLSSTFFELLFLQPARLGAKGFELVRVEPIGLGAISYLAEHSHKLYTVPDRFFEELLAELLHDRGWEVELTRVGADGGIDIIAIRNVVDVSQMMLVQAKRYDQHRKVGVAPVRELLHVVEDKRATCGMLATSSSFTSPAIETQQAYKWRLTLKGHADIVAWLKAYKEKRTHAVSMNGS